MPKAPKAPKTPAADISAESEGAVAGKVSKKDATFADVLTKDGALIRTYSVEDHGEAFQDNAKEFSAHTEGSTIVLR